MRTLFAAVSGVAMLAGAVAASAQDEPLKFGYINKMGDHPWFVNEVAGARAAAEELGVELLVQDVQFDANLTITTLETMIGDGIDGVAVVVPDRALGPVVSDMAEAAGIPIVAVDDDITFSSGEPVPYVGLDAYSIGRQVGAEIARLFLEEGWDADMASVRVASIEDQKADTCMRRNRGAQDGFLEAIPDFPTDQILSVPYDNTMVNAIDVMSTTLTAHPTVERWIFWSCNDDGVLGGVRATENAGIAPENVIGIGIDGSRACEAFGSGNPTGFRGTMFLVSQRHGEAAIRLLHAAVTEGTPIPAENFQDPLLINAGNFEENRSLTGCS